ncbi:acyltransferase family protein [Paraburkholderia graminis]|uniref:acyltransferase family protein n=1 Tax=Paraburkholderia graminis TaxID=60548 RepID=UPI0038BAC7FB
MTIYDVWPYFAIVAMVLLIFMLPIFSFIDEPTDHDIQRRVHALDGLRGLLALSVAIHHLVTAYKYHVDGVWGWLPSGFYNQLGEAGVSLFFMVTGYLFWRRLVQENGQTDFVKLYIGRFFRIAPMYVVVVLIMFAVVAHRTHYELRVPPLDLVCSALRWLALGIGGSQIPLNGDVHANLVLAGVTWTIGYEWAFYVSLLGLYFVARKGTHLAVSGLSFLVLLCVAQPGLAVSGFALLFASGMFAASMGLAGFSAKSKGASVVAVSSLAFAVASSPATYGRATQIFALFIFFVIVSSGNSLFGLLTSRPCERLGNISYSIYLNQGLAITGLYGLPFIRSWAFSGIAYYWASAAGCCIALAALSSVTYALIERPGIRCGRRLSRLPVRRQAGGGRIA